MSRNKYNIQEKNSTATIHQDAYACHSSTKQNVSKNGKNRTYITTSFLSSFIHTLSRFMLYGIRQRRTSKRKEKDSRTQVSKRYMRYSFFFYDAERINKLLKENELYVLFDIFLKFKWN